MILGMRTTTPVDFDNVGKDKFKLHLIDFMTKIRLELKKAQDAISQKGFEEHLNLTLRNYNDFLKRYKHLQTMERLRSSAGSQYE